MLIFLNQISVASAISATRIETALSKLKADSTRNPSFAWKMKIHLNRKYNSLIPVLELDES